MESSPVMQVTPRNPVLPTCLNGRNPIHLDDQIRKRCMIMTSNMKIQPGKDPCVLFPTRTSDCQSTFSAVVLVGEALLQRIGST